MQFEFNPDLMMTQQLIQPRDGGGGFYFLEAATPFPTYRFPSTGDDK